MPTPPPVDVAVSRVVAATPETLYDLVSDITQMSRWSPETVGAAWLGGATGAVVGARFRGRNRLGWARWSTKPVVTVAERGHRFAFRVPGGSGATWTYTFEGVDGGTRIAESASQTKPSPVVVRFVQRRNGVTDRAAHLRSGMQVTLQRLAAAEEADAPVAAQAVAPRS